MSTTTMRRFLDRISLAFIVRRLLWGIPVLLAVVVVSFTVLRFAPGGPFDREKPLPPTIMKGLRAQYKLDRPILPIYTTEAKETPRGKELAAFEKEYSVASIGPVRITTSATGAADTQLFAYLGQLLRGDLGVSMKYTEVNVNDILRATFPVSLKLGAVAFLLTYGIGVLLGVVAARFRGTWIDGAAMVIATLGFSMPNFVLGAFLILIFSLWMRLLPPALWEGPAYVILPALTLAMGPATYVARLTRSGVLDALDEEYIRTARAKGLSERRVLLKHALTNALGPLITVSGPLLATLVTGSFIVEQVFAIPGMGRYFITAVIDRDYPTVMGVTLVYAALIVLANIVVDVLYAVADPRVEE